ncbi:4-diphosphocytidyl-2-C-methyl-D-erythritol kinase [Weissella oryzae SG25]|uniref:4-diphosphocytidyl-2-C-methyl-D-erythritol kinase n=1 Tax=Weissella oryzae (strain DSM 25784 / JCM 18191 / LMG 30913 / SG25) TaxID=1329250 RepID=A0A069CSV6_WEIOS|nr:4-(cytidine 5'-diphospho)-2-C-methyl-D-erythritol kinase [Weissella oryzae]GAK30890.1 4-diphosphocytidyl-2-C-methyl-D-erythritol kinase [Weissella oryzae SG25]
MEVLERAYAKLNISLDTPFVHPNGDQEWDMLMVAIDLADTLTIRTTTKHHDIIVESTSGILPLNEKNLAFQAAMLMRNEAQVSEGVEIHIDKRIPVAAGMGGGSSDAAAVLRGLNRLWKLNRSEQELAQLGLQIDADVPFCVYSRPARVTGRGERVEPLTAKLPPLWLVVSKPAISVSTPKILRLIDYEQVEHGDMDKLMEAVNTSHFNQAYKAMFNVLEPLTATRFPEIIKLKEKMLQFGADAAQMSGTGPTVFGITDKHSRAKRIMNGIKGFVSETYLARLIN